MTTSEQGPELPPPTNVLNSHKVTALTTFEEVSEALKGTPLEVSKNADGGINLKFTVQFPTWKFTPLYNGSVYHYTSYDALINIVQSRTIRATKISHLNDASEAKFGWVALERAIEDLHQDFPEDSSVNVLVEVIGQFKEHSTNLQLFVSCACMQDEVLTQFTTYGEASLEIDTNIPIDAFNDPFPFPRNAWNATVPTGWRAVLYDLEEQKAAAADMLRTMLKDVARHGHTSIPRNDSCYSIYAYWLTILLAHCKDPSFASEQEVRFVRGVMNLETIQHRASPYLGVVPFIELGVNSTEDSSLDPLPITGIRIGVHHYPESAIDGVKSLLRTNKYPEVTVTATAIPFRK